MKTMQKFLSVLLAVTLLCAACPAVQAEGATDGTPDFQGLNDPALLPYLEDTLYQELVSALDSEDYFVENVSAIYISQEYLDELAYNSQANIFFGYTLDELDAQFQGEKYVFTLGDHDETIVQPFEAYDDTMNRIIRNVAVGTGVILICVTVSVVTAGAGAPAVSMIFATAAKTGAVIGLKGALFGGVSAGIVTGLETGDFDAALKAGAVGASEGFKWGAISGSIAGGVNGYYQNRKAALENISEPNNAETTTNIPEPVEAELKVLEKYGGTKQKSYLKGKEVPSGTSGSVRPDVVRIVNDQIEAIEVKRYTLCESSHINALISQLKKQIQERVENLPAGSTQRIVLDIEGQNCSQYLMDEVKERIRKALQYIYPDIPIDFIL